MILNEIQKKSDPGVTTGGDGGGDVKFILTINTFLIRTLQSNEVTNSIANT